MPPRVRMREHLEYLIEVLKECGEQALAARINTVLANNENELDAFLTSNELWGGAGSIADQAGMPEVRTDRRRRIEGALIQLGKEQIRLGKINTRTSLWVETFEYWSRKGI